MSPGAGASRDTGDVLGLLPSVERRAARLRYRPAGAPQPASLPASPHRGS